MNSQQIIEAWNAQADQFNQWSELCEDEKLEWAYSLATQSAAAVLTNEQIQDLLCIGNPTEEESRLIRLGWNAAQGIGGEKP